MPQYQPRNIGLPTADQRVNSGTMRRPLKNPGQQALDFIGSKTAVMSTMFGTVSLLAIFPQTWLAAIPIALAHYAWASGQKSRLPFKTPITWGDIDYGAPLPGGSGFGKAKGILYLGQDQASKEELWMENGDARRHGFFLGTTGSGKALPLDTPILTPVGWVMNGDLRPGDQVIHPFGGTSTVMSIHPQGSVPTVRVWFADGRFADCCREHLWHVKATSRKDMDLPEGFGMAPEGENMKAGDLGILHGVHGDKMRLSVPLSNPHEGLPLKGVRLTKDCVDLSVERGLGHLDYMPSLYGAPEERLSFLRGYLNGKAFSYTISDHGVRLHKVPVADAKILKQIAWSLGGTAIEYERRDRLSGKDVSMMFPGIETIWKRAGKCKMPDGLEITEVEALQEEQEMSCIKLDREDGLYVMDGHVVTHNTELLLGIVSQTLMWSSGFMFVDGKGTTEFYTRVWTLAKRFGREDDIRVLNFTDAGGDPDAPSGGPDVQSNTVNPFASGGADQLMNIVVSLMGDAGQGNDMWKNRAMSLVSAEMKALCELRDRGDILLNVQTIRDFLFLGKGFDAKFFKGRPPTRLEEVPEEAWEEMRDRAGLIELYLRALRGEFSTATKLAMKAFFDTLPGFNIDKAIQGKAQESKCSEQYGFLSMQLTKPLGSLADDYGHIFRTPLGEVDMDDVVLNRRILVVLLPALQKAKEEMQNCGKICVTMAKIMMGNASGFMIQGSRQEIVESKQTRAPSPFIVVLDEAGYYMVEGIDVMMAQARSLGFMIIIAGQDMSAMQKVSPQIAETAAANASIFAAGKITDGDKTVAFIQKLFGRTKVSVTAGYTAETGFLGTKWVDRMDASFEEVDKVTTEELQNMMEGEFYFLFNGALVRSATFYIGGDFAKSFSVNKFLKVRGPMDRVPGLDQSVEQDFIKGLEKSSECLLQIHHKIAEVSVEPPKDSLASVAKTATSMLMAAKPTGKVIPSAWLGGLLVLDVDADFEDEIDPENYAADDWEDGIDGDMDIDAIALDGQLDQPAPAITKRPVPARPDPAAVLAEDEDPIEMLRRKAGQPSAGAHPQVNTSALDHDVSDIGRSLAQATRGASPRTRHKGMVNLLMAQEAAKNKLKDDTSMQGVMKKLEREQAGRLKEGRQSMEEFFDFISENATDYARVFAEQDIDSAVGLEILRRSGQFSPLPLVAMSSSGHFEVTMGELERAIGAEKESEE